jgi:hypothetical protein
MARPHESRLSARSASITANRAGAPSASVTASRYSVAAGRDIRDSYVTIINTTNSKCEIEPFPGGVRKIEWQEHPKDTLRHLQDPTYCPLSVEAIQAPVSHDLFNAWYRHYDVFFRNKSKEDILLVEAI